MKQATLYSLLLLLTPLLSPTASCTEPVSQPVNTQNWTALNARLFPGKTGLKILAEVDKPLPRLFNSQIDQKAGFTAIMHVRVTNPGIIAISWETHKGTPKQRKRRVRKKVKPKDSYQTIIFTIPDDGPPSDFIIQMPWGDSILKSLVFDGTGNDQQWQFTVEKP